MKPDAETARATALKILEECGVKRVPVSLVRVAKLLGVQVEYTPLDIELSGMAFVKEGRRFAWVNALHHPNRQRFTLAHELGHHALHSEMLSGGVHVDKGMLMRDANSASGEDWREIQANNFASELLMPQYALVERNASAIDLDDDEKLGKLAKQFQVSVAAIQIRLLRQNSR